MIIKSLLVFSLVLNLALFTAADYLWITRGEGMEHGAAKIPKRAVAAVPSGPASWSWSQVESADDGVFAANLRAMGCPEATIRGVIGASNGGHGGRGSVEAAALNAVATQVAVAPGLHPASAFAESGHWASFASPSVGAPAAAGSTAMAVASVSGPVVEPSASPVVRVPLVFQQVDLGGGGLGAVSGSGGAGSFAGGTASAAVSPLNGAETAAVARVQAAFVNQLGGADKNPSDPAYPGIWAQAQQNADEMLRAQLGYSRFNDYQINAAQQAAKQR